MVAMVIQPLQFPSDSENWILDFLQASQQAATMAVEDEDENDDAGCNCR
jgi:hypothetical protein